MNALTKLVVGLVSVTFVACAGQTGGVGSGAETGGTHWHTKVYRTGGQEAGQKSIAHTTMTRLSAEQTRASVSLPGLLPRGTYAWGVYSGSCEATGALMGSAENYPMIEPDANSMGSFTAMIQDDVAADGDYVLQIFRDGGARDDVLGCAKLRIGTEEYSEE